MDTPFRVPEPLLHWLDVARAPAGSTVTQGAATRFQQGGWPDYRQHPDTRDMVLTAPSRWEVLRGEAAETDATGTARILHSLRLAGWFDRAGGVLVGRTGAPAHGDFGQLDAVRDALGDLPVRSCTTSTSGTSRPSSRWWTVRTPSSSWTARGGGRWSSGWAERRLGLR